MQQYVSLITLAVDDLDATRRFYVDGLGWQADFDDADVIMLQVGPSLVLSLWDRAGFVAEVGEPTRGLAPVTIAHNVASEADVDAVLETARAAGAQVHGGERREWGGYSGYFVDPDGFRWEVAANPMPLSEAIVAAGRAWASSQARGA